MGYNVRHMVRRGRTYYYNRRVPQRVATAFGCDLIRMSLVHDEGNAARLAVALSERLDDIWASRNVVPVDVGRLIKSLEPSKLDLLQCTDLYLSVRDIAEKPVLLAVQTLIEVAGNRAVDTYTRVDARLTVEALLGNLQTPYNQRPPVSYKPEFLDAYVPGRSFYLPASDREKLLAAGRPLGGPIPAGTYARRILEQLLVDLSWASSRMLQEQVARDVLQLQFEVGQVDCLHLLHIDP